MSLDKIPYDIILIICEYFSDLDKLCLTSVSKFFYKIKRKLWFDTSLDLDILKKISYRNQFKSIIINFDDVHYLLKPDNIDENYYCSDKYICLQNLVSVIITINNGSVKHNIFSKKSSTIIEKLNIQKLIFKAKHKNDKYYFEGPIPSCVKILKISSVLKNYFDGTMLNIIELHISKSSELSQFAHMVCLKKLSFEKNYNGILLKKKLTLPDELEELYNLKYDMYDPFIIPQKIKSLSMNINFLSPNIIPPNCADLKINIEKNIEEHSIPESVKNLTISGCITVKKNLFPNNLFSLNLLFKLCNSIDLKILPTSLTCLKIKHKYNFKPDFVYELYNLTRLKLHCSESNQIDITKLPIKIIHLSINIYKYETKLENNITHLSIRTYIENDKLEYLNETITSLKISIHVDHDDKNILKYIPSTVKKLSLARQNFTNYFNDIPSTVHTLKIIYYGTCGIDSNLPEHITTFKLKGSNIYNLQYLHKKLCRLKISENNKFIITDEIRSKVRVQYYH